MAFLGCASFDVYGTANVDDDFTSHGLGTIVAGAGRCGTAAWLSGAAVGSGPFMGVSAGGLGGWMGAAYKPGGFGSVQDWSVNSASGYALAFIQIRPDGSIKGYKGVNGIIGTIVCSTPPGLIHNGHYSAIGIDFLISTSGYMRIYVDGHLYADSGTVNMHTFYSAGQWTGMAWTPTGYIDDLFWGDNNSSDPNDAIVTYPGDAHVEGQLCLTDAVGGGGTFREWTPSTGTDHGALLDENPPNDDTDFVESGIVGQRESVKFANILATSGQIFGLRHLPNALKTTFFNREMQVGTYVSATESYKAAQALAQTNYRYYTAAYGKNPVANAAWTVATVNAEQALLKLSA